MSRPLEKGRAKGAGWILPRRYENEWERAALYECHPERSRGIFVARGQAADRRPEDIRHQTSKVSKSQTGIASYILAALSYDYAPHPPVLPIEPAEPLSRGIGGRIDPSTQSSLVLAEVVAHTSFLPAQDDDTRVPLFADFRASPHIYLRRFHMIMRRTTPRPTYRTYRTC